MATGRAPLLCDRMGLLTCFLHSGGDTGGLLGEKNKSDAIHLWDVSGQGKQKPL